MKKPTALVELIQELQEEGSPSDVDIYKGSKAVVYIDNKSLNGNDGIELTASECQLLFSSPEAVERMVEAINSQAASLVITNINLPDDTLETLERSFVAVDEE